METIFNPETMLGRYLIERRDLLIASSIEERIELVRRIREHANKPNIRYVLCATPCQLLAVADWIENL